MSALATDAIEIRRVYTRRQGETGEDKILQALDTNELVVEWAAGPAANLALNLAGSITLEFITRDVTNNLLVPVVNPLTNTPGVARNTDGESREGTYEDVFLIAAPNLVAGTTYETVARIVAGARISFSTWMFSA